jgi:hypothetical protein
LKRSSSASRTVITSETRSTERSRQPSAARACLDAAEADVEIAADGRLVELSEGDLDELRSASELESDELRDLDVEADELRRVVGLASMNAPALGVPARRIGS